MLSRVIASSKIKTLNSSFSGKNFVKTFSSTKDDDSYLTPPQKFFNKMITLNPFPDKIKKFEKIGRKDATETVILDSVVKHLNTNSYVQRPGLCVFEVGLIVDRVHGRNSFMDSPLVRGMTSATAGQKRHINTDHTLQKFLANHTQNQYSSQQMALDTEEFIIDYLNHDLFLSQYCSAHFLQKHFIEFKNPVYTFCHWDWDKRRDEDKIGYREHVILILGVDKSQNIY